MAALTGIALWITLVTIFPGLVTIAVIYGSFTVVAPRLMQGTPNIIGFDSEWMWIAIAVTIMILTQAFGILFEELLVNKHWLGKEEQKVALFDHSAKDIVKKTNLKPYMEFQGLYFLLVTIKESDDSQAHFARICAQFFLTNNTLISFMIGILTTIILASVQKPAFPAQAYYYLSGLVICLCISFFVARIRFREMAKALHAIRLK